MPISRFLHFSLVNRSRVSLNRLQPFGSCKIFQCRSYTGNPKYNNGKLYNHRLFPEEPPDYHSRSWRTLIPAGILVIVGAGLLVHYNDEKRAVPKGEYGSLAKNTVKGPEIGGPFSLVDTEGHIVAERNLQGCWTLLYFGYTSSPDVGPAEVQKMAKAIDFLESKQNVKVIPVFVTIDPQRDSPSQLRVYLKEFDQRIIGLTGPISAVRQMAQEYRVFFKKVEEEGDDYLVESSHNMYLLDPNLEIVRCFGMEYDAAQLSEAILNEMNRASKRMGVSYGMKKPSHLASSTLSGYCLAGETPVCDA
ncbi:hypothetical protein Sjap_022217 [Stephania japonica]|uniref:Uncharacterized protein n=1 Tax=Stephania japonica TaxID=461633 RepID=A0AAP0HUU9_9MAGN